MAEKKPDKLTLAELGRRQDIPAAERERIETLVIRLIQIQAESKALEVERGYTDQNTGERHPGVTDELEGLYVKWDIPGVRVENYTVSQSHGGVARIDRNLLLAEGVDPETIQAATVESHWTGVTVRKDRG